MTDAVEKILAHISNACVEDGHEYACTCSACQTLRERTAVRAVAKDCARVAGRCPKGTSAARAIREKYGIE